MTSLGYVNIIPVHSHISTCAHTRALQPEAPSVLSGHSRPDEMSRGCSAAAAAEASVGCVGCARALQKAEPSSLLELSP